MLNKSLISHHDLAEKKAAKGPGGAGKDKEGDELDQVAGNAEDDIGDQILGVREKELLYGPESLLAIYGPMIVHICGSPHKFKVWSLFCPDKIQLTTFSEPHLTSRRHARL